MPPQSSTPRCGVYVIENTANGTVYVGSALDFTSRWHGHRKALVAGSHENSHLQRAWNQYGADAFTFRALVTTAPEDRRQIEAQIMATYAPRTLYNTMLPGARDGALSHSEATRARIRAAGLGRVQSAETIAKRAAAHLGRRHTAETRAKCSAVQKGKQLTPAHRAALQAASQRRWADPAQRAHMAAMKRGQVVSAEARAKIGAALKGRVKSAETRARLSAANKGQVVSAAQRQRLRDVQTGRKHTPEAREKIRAASVAMWARRRAASEVADGLAS